MIVVPLSKITKKNFKKSLNYVLAISVEDSGAVVGLEAAEPEQETC